MVKGFRYVSYLIFTVDQESVKFGSLTVFESKSLFENYHICSLTYSLRAGLNSCRKDLM